jgi:adenine-specific DNA-methyltransferase
MLDFETRDSETFLNVEMLDSPFSYKLVLTEDRERKEKPVDLLETFNYLIGLHVETRKVYSANETKYLVYRGNVDSRDVAVIWREAKGWGKKELEKDKKFVLDKKLTEGADEIYVNGNSFIANAKAIEPVFKKKMFGGI